MRIEIDDILLNKAAIIERCVRRILEEYRGCPELDDFTHLDALTLNIERACQAAIDMAMHIVASGHLGMPQTASGAFELIFRKGIINEKLYGSLKKMIGFRNIAIHEYQILDNEIVRYIAEYGYKDFMEYCRQLGITLK